MNQKEFIEKANSLKEQSDLAKPEPNPATLPRYKPPTFLDKLGSGLQQVLVWALILGVIFGVIWMIATALVPDQRASIGGICASGWALSLGRTILRSIARSDRSKMDYNRPPGRLPHDDPTAVATEKPLVSDWD
jgi:hypothetical protein